MSLSRIHHRVWSPTHRRAIKEESKVAYRDWVDHQPCSLLQYINVIANLFIMGNYFNELRWKIIRANNLLQFCNLLYNDVWSKLSLTLKWICCYNEMLTSTRFPRHNHLEKENIIHMNKNAIAPNVYIRSISYCTKMHKASLLSDRTETCSCKRPCPDHKIVWHMVTILL